MTLMLGIDTGGTYTDAVIYDDAAPPPGILAKAKSPTTHHELSIGIDGAIGAVMETGTAPSDIAMASVSTTLATNALVERKGGRVALILIGFDARAVTRAGLADAMGDEPIIQLEGGHGPTGERQAPLNKTALRDAVVQHKSEVEAFAIVAHFGVRDPVDEVAAAEITREVCEHPVTLGHHLSQGLNGPKRALTAVLNARLIGTITALIQACEAILSTRGITAPLMIVRGDGSLVSAAFARERPIETILSGPAASLVGAAHLCDAPDAVVSDIGGTTTDIAILKDGRPSLSASGARVGGFQTMVEAVAMETHGLGGDSWVQVDDTSNEPKLTLGPRRVVPITRLAEMHSEIIHASLDALLARTSTPPEPLFINRVPGASPNGLKPLDEAFFARLAEAPIGAETALKTRQERSALMRLFDRGLVALSAFTPTDASVVLGAQNGWDRDAAQKASEAIARRKTAKGDPLAQSARALSELVHRTLTRTSADIHLDAALSYDGLEAVAKAGDHLTSAALRGHRGVARVSIGLDLPLIGLGASARLYYPPVADMLGTSALIAEHSDVANAIGAVVGQIRLAREAVITQPADGLFRVQGTGETSDHADLSIARRWARSALEGLTREAASLAGAEDIEISEDWQARTALVENREMFVEATLRLTATGRPRLASVEPA